MKILLRIVAVFTLSVSSVLHAAVAPDFGGDSIVQDADTGGLSGKTLTDGVATGNAFSHIGLGSYFGDALNFTLAAPGAVNGNVVNSTFGGGPFGTVLDIDSGFQWSLFEGDSTSPGNYAGQSGTFGLFDLGVLGAGDYFLNLVGVTTGTLGGNYTVSLGLTAVPLPAAFWLFFTALAGFAGFNARKRI